MSKIDFKTIRVNGTELANVLGLSNMRITQLEDKGVISRNADKQFTLSEAVIGYIEMLRKKPSKTDANYEAARARKMEAAADIEEMNAAKRKGELVEIDDVADIVQTEYGIVRQRLFAIPNKIALDVFSCENPQQVQDVLLSQMNEALSELKYDIGRTVDDDQGDDSETVAEDQPSGMGRHLPVSL